MSRMLPLIQPKAALALLLGLGSACVSAPAPSLTSQLAASGQTYAASEARGYHVLLQGNGRLALLSPFGSQVLWEMPWGGIHDIHVLETGNVMVQRGAHEVVEIDPTTREVVWSYDSSTANGNEGRPVEIHAFQPLPNGGLMIAESGPARIIEIERASGELLHEVALVVDHPHPHMDTRLARKLASGNYLVSHEGDGKVREYDGGSGEVVWEYEVPLFGREPAGGHGLEAFGNKTFAPLRLPGGNTLISTGNGHSVLEVNPAGEVVWSFGPQDMPGQLAWITTLELLPNGNLVFGNCHAGPGNPVLIEVDPRTKEVQHTLDLHEAFGNNVSNSVILGVPGTLR